MFSWKITITCLMGVLVLACSAARRLVGIISAALPARAAAAIRKACFRNIKIPFEFGKRFASFGKLFGLLLSAPRAAASRTTTRGIGHAHGKIRVGYYFVMTLK